MADRFDPTRLGGLIVRNAQAGAFAPSDIAGLKLWLDASNAGSITASGGAVSQWNDLSGTANHVTQATGAKQPATGTRTQNGLNVIDFDGSDDFLQRAAATVTSAGLWTVFAVALGDTFGTNNIVDQDGVTRVAQYLRRSGGTIQSIAFDTLGNPFVDSGSAVSTATAYVWEAQHAASTVEAFINGVSGGSTATTGTNQSGAAQLIIASSNGGTGQFWDGWVAEVLFYDAALNSGDRTSVRNYLNAKWVVF